MTAPNESDDRLLQAMLDSRADRPPLADQDGNADYAAYQKVEALFDLLRRPATAVAAPTDEHLASGTVLGEFTLLQPLASGGMGQVYLARQESLGRLVALKLCKPEIACHPRMKSRFLAEGLSLARLTHANVVPVLSTGEDQGYLYLAMEYVAGPTLAQVLQAVQNASPDALASTVVTQVLASPERDYQSQTAGKAHARLDRAYQTWAVQTLLQVAQGLAAVHEAGILHRDIKPSNIVFAANGVPKIVDFGLARAEQGPSTTVMGEFYGTPAYTSPEQGRGDAEAVSPASDVFSFGVTLFECLTLHRPFSGRTSVDVLNAVISSDPPLLRRLEKRIPRELEAITDKCLRKKPAQRYPSAQALAEDLRAYLELRPVSAKPPSTIGRVGRLIRRRPWVAAFLCTLLCAAVSGAFLAKHAWSDYMAERIKTFHQRVDEGDVALFRCLTGTRPSWLPAVIEQYRQQGINAYSAALEIDSNAVRPLVQRARLYASKKESLELALADLDRAQQLQPDFVSIRKFRGYVLDELGQKEKGRTAKVEANDLYPSAAEDLYWLGVIAYSKESDSVKSYNYFSQSLLLVPNDYWSRLERAYKGQMPTEEGVGTDKRVTIEYDIAKTIRPDLPFASELLAHFYSVGPLRKRELEEQIERFGLDVLRAKDMAELLQKESKYDDAEVILHKLLNQDTGGVIAGEIGTLEYRRRHFEQARDWFRRAIDNGNNDPFAYVRLAYSFNAIKDWKSAETTYLEGIGENPTSTFLCMSLGMWYYRMGRVVDAESIFRKGCDIPCDAKDASSPLGIIQNEVANLSACHQLLALLVGGIGRQVERVQILKQGIARLENGFSSQHADQYQKAQVVEDEISKLKVALGQAYFDLGRREDTLSLINTELERRPLTPYRAGMLASLWNRLGNQQAALEVSRLAEVTSHQQNASSDTLRAARTLVDTQLNQMGLGKELLERLEMRQVLGQELGPLEYGWLGLLYQGEQAVTIVRKGIKKYPDSVSLHSELVALLWKAGQQEEAWQIYERARDLYFARVERSEVFELPINSQGSIAEPLSPVLYAGPWYTFLLQTGKDEEFRRLEERLREACPKTDTDAKDLLQSRATAEYTSGRYAEAIRSLESCLQQKLGNEALLTGALARSHRALGRRQDAIKWYRRAVEISGVDPTLLSEFLCLVVEVQGAKGLLRQLPVYDQARQTQDARRNATLYCFSAWASLATGDGKMAFEQLVQADTYLLLACQQPVFAGDEALVCFVILHIVSENLADKRSNGLAEFVKRRPAERVKTMREAFVLPERM
jgi:serine/threonine protein kinase/Flp pilus assembly protein TadD